jgi:predicted alpha/beta-hydrolase family hydrolase
VLFRSLAPPRLELTPDLSAQVDWLEAETKALRGRLVVVGRSFGGRLAVRLAARRRLAGVVLLGFPVRPPGKRRPLDEAALTSLPCPGLVVQGTKDELGPLRVLRPLCAQNPKLALVTLAGAGHSFGRHERAAIDATVEWISGL